MSEAWDTDVDLGRPGTLSLRAYEMVFSRVADGARDEIIFAPGTTIYRASDMSVLIYRRDGAVVLPYAPHGVLSRRVRSLSYKHIEDGEDYKHDFASGVHCTYTGRRLHLYRPDGKDLWGAF